MAVLVFFWHSQQSRKSTSSKWGRWGVNGTEIDIDTGHKYSGTQHLGCGVRVWSVRICQISNIVVPNVSGSKLIVSRILGLTWNVSNPGLWSYQHLHEYWIAILRHIRSRCQSIFEACHKLLILHRQSNINLETEHTVFETQSIHKYEYELVETIDMKKKI